MKIFKVIYFAFLVCLSVIALFLIISVIPITGNFKTMVVLSGSMQPVIKMGSVVVVKPVNDYKIGDIITFGLMSKTKTPTTHRIFDIKVNAGTPVYITKGDANNAPDTREVSQKEIIGKVLFSIPYLGYAVESARQPIGFALIIIIPAFIIIYDQFRKIKEEIIKMRKKKKEEKIPESPESGSL
ncbi:MAG: type I signal peptidase SipW [Parcubacteria group bacterium Athens1014_10]|nr:MAG: type I signal peptidase SipW [Parcubacteria group bacterium Athens1014_10]TSD04645.1 MAG: type I signal peptidase SipW [Parcubacteria group bacterium Athens0714_12]